MCPSRCWPLTRPDGSTIFCSTGGGGQLRPRRRHRRICHHLVLAEIIEGFPTGPSGIHPGPSRTAPGHHAAHRRLWLGPIFTESPHDRYPFALAKPRIEIRYCTLCRWMLRAAWLPRAHSPPSTANWARWPWCPPARGVSHPGGRVLVWDRVADEGFPEARRSSSGCGMSSPRGSRPCGYGKPAAE